MGVSLDLTDQWELSEFTTSVGQIKWLFTRRGDSAPSLSIERLAMVQYWLGGSVGDWIEGDLDETTQVIERRAVNCNGHNGEQLITSSRITPFASLLGVRQAKLDRAWQCPADGRVYRISHWAKSRTEQIDLPAELAVRCCRPVPVVKVAKRSGGHE